MWDMIHHGDVRTILPTLKTGSVQCVVTSPPYWGLRNYNVKDQIGLERTPEAYVEKMVAVFREVKRVLRDDGTCWLNLGDSFQDKQLVGMPWRVAFALQADGWYLRSDIIWSKPNPMPESVTDRPTKGHEYIFLLSKRPKYYYDADVIREKPESVGYAGMELNSNAPGWSWNPNEKGEKGHPLPGSWQDGTGRNKRTVWTVPTAPFPGAHFATFPPNLIEPSILAGCPRGGVVLDPFMGAGTTAIVALKNARHYIGIELNPEYAQMARDRIEYGTVDEKELVAEREQGVLF